MKKNVIICDICKKTDIKDCGKQLFLIVDRRMDPAGSMENISEYIDICDNCAADILEDIVKTSMGKWDRFCDFYNFRKYILDKKVR